MSNPTNPSTNPLAAPTAKKFNIEVLDSSSGARILKSTGPLTLQTLFEFQETARKETANPIILDLAGIPYMDSAGLGCVISVYTSCQRSGRRFAIAGVAERIRTLFEVTHVDSILPCYQTLADAEAAVIDGTANAQ